MNLHDVTFPLTNVALWLLAYGQNGRTIGTHLWRIEEGTPPDFDLTGRQTYNIRYWTPRRFSWMPFQFARIFGGGYIQPLCGHRSASRAPRVREAYREDTCEACITAARQRGIIPLTYAQATQQSLLRAGILAEAAAWEAAGRPTEWPLSQQN